MVSLGGQKKTILGLDIGSSAIKVVQLNESRSGKVLKSLGIANLPPGAIVEGEIQEKAIIVDSIKKLLKAQKSKKKRVCTSISGYSVIIKKIHLPTTTREELKGIIDVEAEQYIPFDINEVNVDFEILGQSEGSEDQMDVVIVAAKKDIIDSYIDLLVESGLVPAIVDVDNFALENSFTANYPDEAGTLALLDIGANKLNINIIKGGVSLFTRDAPMGGALVTEEIQDRFDLDYQAAESIKIGGVEAPDKGALEDIVTKAVENWGGETNRAIEFLKASYPDEQLQGIYLSGGSSRFEGLDRYLAQETGVSVKIFNPLINIGVDQRKFDPTYIEYISPQFAICIGLALRMGEEN